MNLRIPCRCVRWSLAAGIGVAAMLALLPGGGRALAQEKPPAFEETELMFLGEELTRFPLHRAGLKRCSAPRPRSRL